jgi:hypothetical protein
MRLYAGAGSASRVPSTVTQPGDGMLLAREVAFPVLAVAVIVAYADIRIPLGLPGHRGVVWLTLLVAVALVTHRRETVIAVGAASTIATLTLHAVASPWGNARYLAAAVLLYATATVPAVRRRRWLIVLAAAPIHLVALAGPVGALVARGYLSALVSTGMVEKAVFHLGFGLVAGLLAWAVAFGMDWNAPRFGEIRRKEYPS